MMYVSDRAQWSRNVIHDVCVRQSPVKWNVIHDVCVGQSPVKWNVIHDVCVRQSPVKWNVIHDVCVGQSPVRVFSLEILTLLLTQPERQLKGMIVPSLTLTLLSGTHCHFTSEMLQLSILSSPLSKPTSSTFKNLFCSVLFGVCVCARAFVCLANVS